MPIDAARFAQMSDPLNNHHFRRRWSDQAEVAAVAEAQAEQRSYNSFLEECRVGLRLVGGDRYPARVGGAR